MQEPSYTIVRRGIIYRKIFATIMAAGERPAPLRFSIAARRLISILHFTSRSVTSSDHGRPVIARLRHYATRMHYVDSLCARGLSSANPCRASGIAKCDTSRGNQVTLANDRRVPVRELGQERAGAIYILPPAASPLCIVAILSRVYANGNCFDVSSKHHQPTRTRYIYIKL